MLTIKRQFKEIKNASVEMISFVRETCPWLEKFDFRTSFNHDLELAGLDWDIFLMEYEKKFDRRNLKGLLYENYFYDVGPDINWFFGEIKKSILIGKFQFKTRPKKPALTIGDFIVSELTGKFVKREEVEIKLK